MIKFIVKRLVALIPVLLGVTLLVFFILDLAPGDPAKTILVNRPALKTSPRCGRRWGSTIRSLFVTAAICSIWFRETWELLIKPGIR